jgi:hypothetical protein
MFGACSQTRSGILSADSSPLSDDENGQDGFDGMSEAIWRR